MEELEALARQLYRLFLVVFLLIGVIFVALITYKPALSELIGVIKTEEKMDWAPRDALSEVDNMPSKVKQGYYLIAETTISMGPSAKSPEDRYSGNNLACANCHLKAGAQAGSGSWVGILERFPQFGGRGNRIGTIEDRINGCMERSMNGRKLAVASDKMEAIVAYMDWLGKDCLQIKRTSIKGIHRSSFRM